MNKSDLKLGDFCTVKSSKRVFAKEYVDLGVPFFRSKDVIDKALGVFQKYDLFISVKRYKELKEKTGSPQKGDLLINSVGNRTGHSYVVQDEGEFYFKDGNILWLSNFVELNPYFLSYWLKSSLGQNILESVMIGSAQKALTIEAVRNLRIPNFKIENQLSIASVLCALDDKIENNRKMSQTLEEMAQTTFKSWFVDFDPVHAKVAGNAPAHMDSKTAALFPNSFCDDGLPSGWYLKPISDLAIIKGGKQLTKSSINTGGINPVFGGAGVMGRTDNNNADGFVIVVGRVGAYCGQFFSHRGKAWINNNASQIIPNDGVSGDYLFCSLKSLDLNPIKKGAAQPFVSNSDIAAIQVVYPNEPLLNCFDKVAHTLQLKIEANKTENTILTSLRDELLPNLMSGKILIKDAEREVEAVV